MELRRAAVVQLYEPRDSKVKITNLLKTNKMFINRSLSRYSDTGLMIDRRRPGGPQTVRTFSKISRVSQGIRRNPSRSIRIMAKEIQISRESMRKIVRSDLQMKAYKLNKCQLLSERNKNKRLQRCKELVSRFKNHAHRDILFSDEKLFTLEQVLNFQNDRILATAKNTFTKSTFQVSRAKKPASVMVWGGITFDCRTPLVFIPQCLKLNQTVYRDLILKKVVKPWAKNIIKIENGYSNKTRHLLVKRKRHNSGAKRISQANFCRRVASLLP